MYVCGPAASFFFRSFYFFRFFDIFRVTFSFSSSSSLCRGISWPRTVSLLMVHAGRPSGTHVDFVKKEVKEDDSKKKKKKRERKEKEKGTTIAAFFAIPRNRSKRKKKRQLKKQKQNKLGNSVVQGRVSRLLRGLCCCCCCCCWWWWWWWPVDVEKTNKQTTKLGNSIVPSSRKS